ncbi:MAG: FumA C-terminus/TtdB family hydratase beta subunit [Candidatus Neomarinimicrobiota bacterium]|jgi:fumarate hydratase class I
MSKISLTLPLTNEEIRRLKIGDTVLLSGIIVTARDMAHSWLLEEKREELSELLRNSAIYHCGPIMLKEEGKWICKAAGPTTSIREEAYMAEILQEYGISAVIGKGGMGERTAKALQEFSAVYLSAVGGAAVLLADHIESVEAVYQLEEFGVPEALWVLKIKAMPLIVSMDSHGNSLHKNVLEKSCFVLNNK